MLVCVGFLIFESMPEYRGIGQKFRKIFLKTIRMKTYTLEEVKCHGKFLGKIEDYISSSEEDLEFEIRADGERSGFYSSEFHRKIYFEKEMEIFFYDGEIFIGNNEGITHMEGKFISVEGRGWEKILDKTYSSLS